MIHLDGRDVAVRPMRRMVQQDVAEELAGRAVARAREGKRWMALKNLWRLALVVMFASGCATTYRPNVTGPEPFAFTPTPEQCAQLLKERRTYRATEKTATYVSGATALLSVLFLGLVEEKAAPAASAGATLLASGAGVFAGSQVESLDEEIGLGQCR